MQKIEVVVRITKDHCPPQEQTIFEWFDLMRNPTDALSRPDLEINLEHHRVFKRGTEVYMSRYEYGLSGCHPETIADHHPAHGRAHRCLTSLCSLNA